MRCSCSGALHCRRSWLAHHRLFPQHPWPPHLCIPTLFRWGEAGLKAAGLLQLPCRNGPALAFGRINGRRPKRPFPYLLQHQYKTADVALPLLATARNQI